MTRRLRDGGSSSTFGILSAIILLSIGFTVPLAMMSDPPVEDLEYHALRNEAEAALDTLTQTRGSRDWAQDPQNATGYGLLEEGRRPVLSPTKVEALKRADDDAVYSAFRDSTGSGADVRLALQPLLPSLADRSWRPLGLDGIAYLAHYAPPKMPITLLTKLNVSSTAINLSATITNVGEKPAIYSAQLGLGDHLQDLVLVDQERQTRLLAPNESETVYATFRSLTTWDPGISGGRVSVTDAYGNAATSSTGTLHPTVWLPIDSMPTQAPVSYNHLIEAAESFYVSGTKPSFVLDHYGSLGVHVLGASGIFVLLGPDGREWVNQTVNLPLSVGGYTFECGNCTQDGVYTGILWDTSLTVQQADHVVFSTLPLFTQRTILDARSEREIEAIASLVPALDPARYHPLLAPGGDVFGDDARGDTTIAAQLSRYSTLVIGSNIKQSSLAPHATKTAIYDWVNAGGTLIVLGSQDGPHEWMNSLWRISLQRDSAPTEPLAPDHPALRAPDALRTDSYATWGRLWEAETPSAFDHVTGATGSRMRDALAFSKPGAFGSGTLVLSAYTPGNLSASHDGAEARRLLHNVLVHAHTRFYLDYGPDVPPHATSASASRIVVGEDPLFPEGLPVRVVIWAFR